MASVVTVRFVSLLFAFDVHYASVASFHVYVSEDEMCHAHSLILKFLLRLIQKLTWDEMKWEKWGNVLLL